VISSLSYNQLVERLVAYRAALEEVARTPVKSTVSSSTAEPRAPPPCE
jgi:hypothetical protein